MNQLKYKHAGELSSADRLRAEAVASRLGSELGAVVRALPAAAWHASGMARHLGIDRATCQRLVAGLAADGVERLVRLPGAQGLRQILDACRRVGMDEARVLSALLAVEAADAAVRQIAGSQSRLSTMLSGTTRHANESAGDQGRDLFDAARRVTGCSNDLSVVIFAFRGSPSQPGRMDRLTVKGVAGHRVTRPDAVPMFLLTGRSNNLEAGTSGATASNLDQSAARGSTPGALLEEFSSSPAPTVVSRGPKGLLLQLVDPAAGMDAPVDVFLAHAMLNAGPMPADETPPIEEAWALVDEPSRRLIFDVWLDRAMAARCIPDLQMHLWKPNMELMLGDRWYSRVPGGPRLQLLGQGIERAHSPLWARQGELTQRVFERAGWDGSGFVGFRCEVEYPLWRVGYCMTFDFAGAVQASV